VGGSAKVKHADLIALIHMLSIVHGNLAGTHNKPNRGLSPTCQDAGPGVFSDGNRCKIHRNRGHTSIAMPPNKSLICFFVVIFQLLAPLCAVAQSAAPLGKPASPIGLWETIDDKTGKPTAVVEIFEKDAKLFGRIEQILTRGDEKSVCTACSDDRKNQPIVGMIIIRNIKPAGNEYGGGDILDPDSGSVYRCKMHLENNGSLLIVRGYIGLSFIGRSQTWHRRQ
jgi:uncharacterized protein (DUF2147 family)